MDERGSDTADLLRIQIARQLEEGLQTTIWPRPETDEAAQEIVLALQNHPADDLTGRMVIAGLADHPVEFGSIAQECGSCVYFMVHHLKCEQPELDLPVEQQWSCRLWRM